MTDKLKISRAEALDQAFSAVRLAKSLSDDVEFSPEDATRSDPDFLCRMLEAVIEGNIVADFPLCNKSFNCSYSGHDL